MYDFSISASFVEIYREDIRDLLAPAAPPVSVRELPGGGVCLAGATEQPVGSMEDMAQLIERGTLCRATSATGMNKRSSRSHAIFTISLEKRRRDTSGPSPSGPAASDDSGGAGLGHAVESPRDATAAEDEVGEADYVCAKVSLRGAREEGCGTWLTAPGSSLCCFPLHLSTATRRVTPSPTPSPHHPPRHPTTLPFAPPPAPARLPRCTWWTWRVPSAPSAPRRRACA